MAHDAIQAFGDLGFARELSANVFLLAKTDEPDPRLSGTIHTAAEKIENAGDTALAVIGDVRDEDSVQRAAERGVDMFAASTS